MNNCFFFFFVKSTSLLFNFVSVAASITMAIPQNYNLKLYEATPRTGRTMFWVTTLLRHTPICVLREEWGVGGDSRLTSRQLMSQLFNYLTSHSACTSISRMFSPWASQSLERESFFHLGANVGFFAFG